MIEVSRVSKSYDTPAGPLSVLRDLDLSAGAGETVAIVGPSGSGKTTLLNLLGALDQPSSGSIVIDGVKIAELNPEAAARFRNRSIGFIFQLHYLLPQCTILENVLVPRLAGGWDEDESTVRSRAESLLEQVGLKDRMEHRPAELSGGERQRVALARALINQPDLILADEPTGNLDSKSAADVLSLLEELHDGGQTIVLVTHDNDVAARATRRIHLRDGKVCSDARH